MYLVISNNGVVEKEAFTLVGASTKRDDSSSIGQFGSGNKYALAYLLRNNIPVRIFTDGEELPVSVENTKFRDKDFGVIHIGGQPTSLTTDMGGCDWELWQAIRELYCNALDEGEEEPLCVTHDISPFACSGRTAIVIDYTDEVKAFMMNFHLYFCQNTPIVYEDKCVGRILEKKSPEGELRIYRKGILVDVIKTDSKEALYDYDFNDIHINESRVSDYYWQTPEKILELFFSTENKHLIQKFMTEDCYEMSCGDRSIVTPPQTFSQAWGDVLSQMVLATNSIYTFMHTRVSGEEVARCRIVPDYFLDKAVSCFPDVAVLGQSLSEDEIDTIRDYVDDLEWKLRQADELAEELGKAGAIFLHTEINTRFPRVFKSMEEALTNYRKSKGE